MDDRKPCLGCEDKVPGCSDHCDKPAYLKFRDRLETIRRNRARHSTVDGYQSDQIRKNRRSR
jgi:hypothetical protein